jgi:hypothetical protein
MKKNQARTSDESKGDSSAANQSEKNETKFPGYPSYPGEEDLYVQNEGKSELDPEDPAHLKTPNALPDEPNHLITDDSHTGEDLDIPGAELDDAQEAIGSEDEENNYYSLGGDSKEGLEEDQGDSA